MFTDLIINSHFRDRNIPQFLKTPFFATNETLLRCLPIYLFSLYLPSEIKTERTSTSTTSKSTVAHNTHAKVHMGDEKMDDDHRRSRVHSEEKEITASFHRSVTAPSTLSTLTNNGKIM